jgi:hypothetical protein
MVGCAVKLRQASDRAYPGDRCSGEVGSEREAAVAARLGAGLGHEKRAKLLVRFV